MHRLTILLAPLALPALAILAVTLLPALALAQDAAPALPFDWVTLAGQVAATIVPALLALLTYGCLVATRWLRARTESEYLQGVLDRLDEAVVDVVAELEQTLVADLRAAGADGKIDAGEIAAIRERATAGVLDYLGPKGLKMAERVLDREALERVITAKIERAVLEMKGGAS
jgi:hypothetical protein